MEWNESVFGGYGLSLWFVALPLVPVSVLFGAPAALWMRDRWRPEWLRWLLAVLAALALTAWWTFRWLFPDEPLRTVGLSLPFALVLVIPQLLARPLSKGRPWRLLLLTLVFAAIGVAVWLVAAISSGATSD